VAIRQRVREKKGEACRISKERQEGNVPDYSGNMRGGADRFSRSSGNWHSGNNDMETAMEFRGGAVKSKMYQQRDDAYSMTAARGGQRTTGRSRDKDLFEDRPQRESPTKKGTGVSGSGGKMKEKWEEREDRPWGKGGCAGRLKVFICAMELG